LSRYITSAPIAACSGGPPVYFTAYARGQCIPAAYVVGGSRGGYANHQYIIVGCNGRVYDMMPPQYGASNVIFDIVSIFNNSKCSGAAVTQSAYPNEVCVVDVDENDDSNSDGVVDGQTFACLSYPNMTFPVAERSDGGEDRGDVYNGVYPIIHVDNGGGGDDTHSDSYLYDGFLHANFYTDENCTHQETFSSGISLGECLEAYTSTGQSMNIFVKIACDLATGHINTAQYYADSSCSSMPLQISLAEANVCMSSLNTYLHLQNWGDSYLLLCSEQKKKK